MSFNRKLLSQMIAESKQKKTQPKPKDRIVDPMGQWAHPGEVTRIPSNRITMQGVPYPVLGVGNTGQQQMMFPGQEYAFLGSDYVDEYPMMKAQNGIQMPDLPDVYLNLPKYNKPPDKNFGVNPYMFGFNPQRNVNIYGIGAQGYLNIFNSKKNKLDLTGNINSVSVGYPGGVQLFGKPQFSPGVTFKHKFRDGGESYLSQAQNGKNLSKRILRRYPGMQSVYGSQGENLNIIKDPNFKPAEHGFGNIEFIFPGSGLVKYSDDYQYQSPTPDKYTAVYNPKGANKHDVFLDMMHGMRNDPEYMKLMSEFADETKRQRGKDMDYFYNYDLQNRPYVAAEGRERWNENYIDGLLRAHLAKKGMGRRSFGAKDYKMEREGSSSEMYNAANKIYKYLKGKRNGGDISIPELPKAQIGKNFPVSTYVKKPIVQIPIGPANDPDVIKYFNLKKDETWGSPYEFMMNWYSNPLTKAKLKSQGFTGNPMKEALNQKLFKDYLDWQIYKKNQNRKDAENIYPDDYENKTKLQNTLDKYIESVYEDKYETTGGFHNSDDSTVAINKRWDLDHNARQRTAVHELTHATPLDNYYRNYFKTKKPKNPEAKEKEYFDQLPIEIYPRIMDLRYQMNLKPGKKVTPEMLGDYHNDSDYDLRNYYSPKELADIMNEIAYNSKQNLTSAKIGGSIPNLEEGNWLDRYDEGGQLTKFQNLGEVKSENIDPQKIYEEQLAKNIAWYEGRKSNPRFKEEANIVLDRLKQYPQTLTDAVSVNYRPAYYMKSLGRRGAYDPITNKLFLTDPEKLFGEKVSNKIINDPKIIESLKQFQSESYAPSVIGHEINHLLQKSAMDQIAKHNKDIYNLYDYKKYYDQYKKDFTPQSHGEIPGSFAYMTGTENIHRGPFTDVKKMQNWEMMNPLSNLREIYKIDPSKDTTPEQMEEIEKDLYKKFFDKNLNSSEREKVNFMLELFRATGGAKGMSDLNNTVVKNESFSSVLPFGKHGIHLPKAQVGKNVPAYLKGPMRGDSQMRGAAPVPSTVTKELDEFTKFRQQNPGLNLKLAKIAFDNQKAKKQQISQAENRTPYQEKKAKEKLEAQKKYRKKVLGISEGTTQHDIDEARKQNEKLLNAIEVGTLLEAPVSLGARALTNFGTKTLPALGEYLTTQTPLRNAYKLNPFAIKENPEMFLYRARPIGQDVNMNMAAQLRAKQAAGEPLTWYQKNLLNPQTNPQMLAREKYYGQWFEKDPSRLDFYIDPGTRNFADNETIEILRTRLPKTEANKLNVSQFDDAKVLSASPETEFILPKNMINSAERFPESSWQQLIQEDKAFNTPHWIRGYKEVPKPTSLSSSVESIAPSVEQPWAIQEIPGLHIKSTMTGSPLEKQLSKTGQIDVNSIRAYIGKADVGSQDKFIIDKVLNEKFAGQKKIDYNTFRNAVSDELIPLNKNEIPDFEYSNWGLDRLGYTGPKLKSVNSAIKATEENIASLEKQLTNWKNTDDVVGYEQLKNELAQAKSKLLENQKLLENVPLENRTFTFSNAEKFGRGDTKHFTDPSTLGHTRTLVSKEEPHISHVLESQSDFYQNEGKTVLEKLKGLKEKDVVKFEKRIEAADRQLKNLSDDKKLLEDLEYRYKNNLPDANGDPVHESIINQLKYHIKTNEEMLNLRKAELQNWEQKLHLGKSHQERFLQENIRQAVENGQTTMRYPTSETAAKIQGYKKRDYDTVFKELEDLRNGKISDVTKLSSDTKNIITGQGNTSLFDTNTKSPRHYKDVLFDLDKNENFAKFLENKKGLKGYDPEYQTILKKYDDAPKMIKKTIRVEPKLVTDPKGNTWYEFDIPESFKKGKAEIKAFKKGGQINWLDKYN